jgi:hypothetical protein
MSSISLLKIKNFYKSLEYFDPSRRCLEASVSDYPLTQHRIPEERYPLRNI